MMKFPARTLTNNALQIGNGKERFLFSHYKTKLISSYDYWETKSNACKFRSWYVAAISNASRILTNHSVEN